MNREFTFVEETELSRIESFAGLLREILDRKVEDFNDLVDLVVTAEELRRMVLMLEERPEEVHYLLEEYEDALPYARGLLPEYLELEESIDDAFGLLARSDPRDPEEIEDALVGVDEVLYLVAAGERVGLLLGSDADALAKHARDRAAALAPRVPWTWQAAEYRSCALAPDARTLGLFDWIDELAQLSESRLELASVLGR